MLRWVSPFNRDKTAKKTAEFPPFALNWTKKQPLAFRQLSTHAIRTLPVFTNLRPVTPYWIQDNFWLALRWTPWDPLGSLGVPKCHWEFPSTPQRDRQVQIHTPAWVIGRVVLDS